MRSPAIACRHLLGFLPMTAAINSERNPLLNVEIDGVAVQVDHGTTIIDAADKLGIAIPRFCYHKKLSVAANCRMCLVQVEKFNKPLPACATPVADGMKIFTRSKTAI